MQQLLLLALCVPVITAFAPLAPTYLGPGSDQQQLKVLHQTDLGTYPHVFSLRRVLPISTPSSSRLESTVYRETTNQYDDTFILRNFHRVQPPLASSSSTVKLGQQLPGSSVASPPSLPAITKRLQRALSRVNPSKLAQRHGVPFVLAYSLISQINGALTLSVSWYLTCQRTGLSPLVPGQWKALLATYGSIYAAVQVLKPLRVAAALALAPWSRRCLDRTTAGGGDQRGRRRGAAVLAHYLLGYALGLPLAVAGVGVASRAAGVPLWAAAAAL